MVNKIFPTEIPSKPVPVVGDILLIADSQDNNEMKKVSIGDITANIGSGLITDVSPSLVTTYSSTNIKALNDAQDLVISGNNTTLGTSKLNRNAQLRTGNGAWKTSYNDASGNEVELTLGTAGYVLQANGASAPNWVAPSVNIAAQTEDTVGDMDNDYNLIYDTSAGVNKKQKVNVFRASSGDITTGTSTTKFISVAQLFARTVRIAGSTSTEASQVSEVSWGINNAGYTLSGISLTVNSPGQYMLSYEKKGVSNLPHELRTKKNGTTIYTDSVTTSGYLTTTQDYFFVAGDVITFDSIVGGSGSGTAYLQNVYIKYTALPII